MCALLWQVTLAEGERYKWGDGDVQITLNVDGLNLWRQAEGVHEELSQRRRRLGLLVQDVVNVVGDALEHVQDVCDGALQGIEIGHDVL